MAPRTNPFAPTTQLHLIEENIKMFVQLMKETSDRETRKRYRNAIVELTAIKYSLLEDLENE